MTASSMRRVTTALLLLLTVPAAADYKIVEHNSTRSGKPASFTRLVQGERQREELWNGWVRIYQCDRQQMIELDSKTRLFRIVKLSPDGLPLQRPAAYAAYSERLKTSSMELPDRATVFGHPAWHVQDVLDNVQTGFRTIIDSWYIDLPFGRGCTSAARAPYPLDVSYGPAQSQSVRRGFPVLTRHVYKTAPTEAEWVIEVTEFQETKLDRALFEVPAGYQEALDVALTIPNTPTNRAKQAWNSMWTSLARFIYD